MNRHRRGVTLIELLIASLVMAMIAGALGTLMQAVQMSTSYSYGHGTANQHARVAIERINRAVRQAAATSDNPGAVVLSETVGTWRFPDTLVVWQADSNGDELPQVNELVVFCPNPNKPSELWELSTTSDIATVSFSDTSILKTAITRLKAAATSERVVLTDFLRIASLTDGASTVRRSALRFEVELAPTRSQWSSYQAGTTNWSDLSWAQGIYGLTTGMRQSWVRYEIQLTPGDYGDESENNVELALPFLGSATLYYELNK